MALVGLFAVGAADASAATIGHTGSDYYCPASVVTAEPSYVVPSGGGTITSFSILSTPANAAAHIDFLVLRPAGAGNYTVVGKTGMVTLAGTGLETFPASIQAKAGDVLGFATGTYVADCVRTASGSGFVYTFASDPSPGDTVSLTFLGPAADLNESANLSTAGTTVACSPVTVRAGQSTTCTATVTGSTHPSGTVSFASNSSGSFSSTACTLVLIGGNQARCSVTYTPATVGSGTHTVYANYSGDANNPPSHASTTVTVTAGSSTTTVGCGPSTVGVGQATTCTATVTGQSHPTGSVSFASNGSGSFSAASCTLVLIGGNQARCSVTYTPSAIPPTTQTIYANYSGDANNSPSHASTTITVHV